MFYYVFLNVRARWQRAKGHPEKHLVASYRHVRKIRERHFRRKHTVIRNRVPVKVWTDGRVTLAVPPETRC